MIQVELSARCDGEKISKQNSKLEKYLILFNYTYLLVCKGDIRACIIKIEPLKHEMQQTLFTIFPILSSSIDHNPF